MKGMPFEWTKSPRLNGGWGVDARSTLLLRYRGENAHGVSHNASGIEKAAAAAIRHSDEAIARQQEPKGCGAFRI